MPEFIFDNEYVTGMLSSVVGECAAFAETSYDATSGIAQIKYDHKVYMEDPTCNPVNPKILGYSNYNSRDTITLQADVVSAYTAIAVRFAWLNGLLLLILVLKQILISSVVYILTTR